jgi:prophage tail gpP-like protein
MLFFLFNVSSRYWDRDDRRRDQDYAEEDSQRSPNLNKNIEKSQNNGKLYNEEGREELNLFKDIYDDGDVIPEDEYDDGIDAQDDMVMSENFNKREKERDNLKANKDLHEISIYSDNGSDKKGKGHEKKSGLKKKPKKHKFSSEFVLLVYCF